MRLRLKESSSPLAFAGTPGSQEHWWDLCAGPHVQSTGDISPDAIDLETVAGKQLMHVKLSIAC